MTIYTQVMKMTISPRKLHVGFKVLQTILENSFNLSTTFFSLSGESQYPNLSNFVVNISSEKELTNYNYSDFIKHVSWRLMQEYQKFKDPCVFVLNIDHQGTISFSLDYKVTVPGEVKLYL